MLEPKNLVQLDKSPWLAVILSIFFPGLGHLYLKVPIAALSYGVMTVGVWVTYLTSHSILTRIAIMMILPFIMIPAARDSYLVARGKKKPVSGEESVIYVIWMLCCVGPFALPLLWQNKKFSGAVKVIWTIIVISVVVFFLMFLSWFGKVSHDVFGI